MLTRALSYNSLLIITIVEAKMFFYHNKKIRFTGDFDLSSKQGLPTKSLS